MDHQSLANILGGYGEFLGSIAVLVTLVYLSLQVGQAKLATRAQIVQSAMDQINQVNLQIASDPGWGEINAKSALTLDDLTIDQRNQYAFIELAICRAIESLYFHYLDGYVDRRVWGVQENALRALAGAPGWQQWWGEQPFGFSTEFSALVDGMIEESISAGNQTSWRGLTGVS